MEIFGTKRLDHLGLVMGVIRELGIIELIPIPKNINAFELPSSSGILALNFLH